MKIYNEIISRFNETTQQWEDVYEDSFEHTGEVMLMMPEECGIVGDMNGDGTATMAVTYLQIGTGLVILVIVKPHQIQN